MHLPRHERILPWYLVRVRVGAVRVRVGVRVRGRVR